MDNWHLLYCSNYKWPVCVTFTWWHSVHEGQVDVPCRCSSSNRWSCGLNVDTSYFVLTFKQWNSTQGIYLCFIFNLKVNSEKSVWLRHLDITLYCFNNRLHIVQTYPPGMVNQEIWCIQLETYNNHQHQGNSEEIAAHMVVDCAGWIGRPNSL